MVFGVCSFSDPFSAAYISWIRLAPNEISIVLIENDIFCFFFSQFLNQVRELKVKHPEATRIQEVRQLCRLEAFRTFFVH